MKKIWLLLLCVLFLIPFCPVRAEGGLDITLHAAEETDIASGEKIMVSAVSSEGTINYVSLWVNGREVETQTAGTDGLYTFDYAYDAIGIQDVSATASDSAGNMARADKKVHVYKTVITDDGTYDFSDYTGGNLSGRVKSGNFGAAGTNSENCTVTAETISEEYGTSLFATMNGNFGPGNGPWVGYTRQTSDDIEVCFDFLLTAPGMSTAVCAYDRTDTRIEWNPFTLSAGMLEADGQSVLAEVNCWYSVRYTVYPGRSQHSLVIEKDGETILEYSDIPIGKTIGRFDDIRFFFGGGDGVSFAFDNFSSRVMTDTPEIEGVSASGEGELTDCLDYSADSLYVCVEDGFRTIQRENVTLENEIGNVKLQEVTFDGTWLRIVPDYTETQFFESANSYMVVIGEDTVLEDGSPLGCKAMYRFYTTPAELDLAAGTFSDNNGSVRFTASLKNSGESRAVRLLLLAFKDGIPVSVKQKTVVVSSDVEEEIAGEFASGTELQALAVGDDLRPISNKVYRYVVK